MTPHIYVPPYAAVDELPMAHRGLLAGAVMATTMNLQPVLDFDGEERRSGDDRRCPTNQRSGEERRGDDRVHCLPRRTRGDRRER